MQINVEETEIRKIANQLYESSVSLEKEIKKLRNIIGDISTAWTGNDATKYINIFQEKYIAELEALKEIISEYAIYLNNIPGVYELLENIYSNKYIG